jgi:hypothetical protein
MSSWGNNDNAANAPYWAVNSTIMNVAETEQWHATANSTNVAVLYANTTANVWTDRMTVGLFGVDAQEAGALEGTAHRGIHTGWVLRTVGQGGRAGRIQEEVLVAMSTMGASNSDGDAQTYANVSISLSGPSDGSVISSVTYANVVSFTVAPTLSGNTSASLTYQWQYLNGGGAMVNIPANTAPIQWANPTTATLQARPKTTANNGTVLRVMVTAADEGVVAYSSNVTLTVT